MICQPFKRMPLYTDSSVVILVGTVGFVVVSPVPE